MSNVCSPSMSRYARCIISVVLQDATQRLATSHCDALLNANDLAGDPDPSVKDLDVAFDNLMPLAHERQEA